MPRIYTWTALIAFTLGIGLFLQTLFYSDAWQSRQRVRHDLSALELQNAVAEENIERLRGEIEGMRTRPLVQERAVRQELGYVRAGEVVLELGANAP